MAMRSTLQGLVRQRLQSEIVAVLDSLMPRTAPHDSCAAPAASTIAPRPPPLPRSPQSGRSLGRAMPAVRPVQVSPNGGCSAARQWRQAD